MASGMSYKLRWDVTVWDAVRRRRPARRMPAPEPDRGPCACAVSGHSPSGPCGRRPGKMGCLPGERQFLPGLERRVHVRESGVHGRPMAAHQTPGIDHGPRAAPARWAAQGDSDMARCCSFRFTLFFQALSLLTLTAKRRRPRTRAHLCARAVASPTNMRQESGHGAYRLQSISARAHHRKQCPHGFVSIRETALEQGLLEVIYARRNSRGSPSSP